MTCEFWPWFFWLDAILICVWAFFRYPAWGIEGETIRVKTLGVAVVFLTLGGVSDVLTHTRMEWAP